MSTGWAAIQLINTNQFHDDFSRLTTHGACGVNLLPTYWSERAKAEIPTLVLNAVALLVSSYLTWKLLKVRILCAQWHISRDNIALAVLRMADIQEDRRISNNQPRLPWCPLPFHRYSAVRVLRSGICFALDRPGIQRRYCTPHKQKCCIQGGGHVSSM